MSLFRMVLEFEAPGFDESNGAWGAASATVEVFVGCRLQRTTLEMVKPGEVSVSAEASVANCSWCEEANDPQDFITLIQEGEHDEECPMH